MHISEIANLLDVNAGRIEAIAKELKIASSDLSDEQVEVVTSVVDHMNATDASIEEAVWAVYGQHQQQQYQQRSQQAPKQNHQPQEDTLSLALGSLGDQQRQIIEGFKSTAESAAIAAMQSGQQAGADLAAVTAASTLNAYIHHSAAYTEQISQHIVSQVSQGARNAIAQSVSSFTLAEGYKPASLPAPKLRQIQQAFN